MRLFGLKCVWVDKWQYYLWKQQLENRKVIISFGNFNDLTNFMKQSHSWGANSSSLSQDIPLHFMEVESSLTPSQQPETSLSWARSIQSRSPAIVLLKIYFNIIIPLKSTPSKFFFFFQDAEIKGWFTSQAIRQQHFCLLIHEALLSVPLWTAEGQADFP